MRGARIPGRWVAGVLAGCLLVLWPAPPVAAAAPPLPAPAGWPLTGIPKVTRGFDPPVSHYGPGHRGVDLAARAGDPVLAAVAGRVTFAGSVAGRAVVTLDHGGVSTTYEPVRASVGAGQWVGLGQPIGVLGHGGHCGGRCLHWGLRQDSEYLDPLLLLSGGNGALRLVPKARRAVVEREARARAQAALEVALPAGRPGSHGFLNPVPGGITSPYGMRFHPVLKIWKLHDGTDFGASCGTAIRAAYGGRVGRRYSNPGYGNRLFIDHGTVDGVRVTTAYNHANRYVVGPGQLVRRGQVIGYVGRTGLATGCHLHLMIWLNGRMVNPMSWL
jgi:murein DD-endopeptidase MepM/ murein hydrolase activator NlpD